MARCHATGTVIGAIIQNGSSVVNVDPHGEVAVAGLALGGLEIKPPVIRPPSVSQLAAYVDDRVGELKLGEGVLTMLIPGYESLCEGVDGTRDEAG